MGDDVKLKVADIVKDKLVPYIGRELFLYYF